MRYLSLFSGIEAASVAWEPLGWNPVGFAEIEPFPSAVLAHRYPHVKNYGDVTKYKEWGIEPGSIDVLVGGSPCQSFSVAGLRKGLNDPRGNLMLTYGAIAGYYKPNFIVWENVPGVLSSNEGRDFGTFLGMLAELGYGVSYRILDAQYVRTKRYPMAVPQRRRRVYVVGYLGDWRRSAAVLFDSEMLPGNHPPSREKGKGVAPCLGQSLKSSGGIGIKSHESINQHDPGEGLKKKVIESEYYEHHPADSRLEGPFDVANTVAARYGTGGGNTPIVMSTGQGNAEIAENHAPTLNCNHEAPILAHTTGDGYWKQDDVAGTLRAREQDSHEKILAFPARMSGTQCAKTENVSPAICAKNETAISYGIPGNWIGREPKNGGNAVEPMHDIAPCLTKTDQHGVSSGTFVRRLTPRECERLQGFPDDWTLVPWRGKPAPDGPRYKACGNSMAVNVMQYIGLRIELVEQCFKEE